MTNVSKVQLVHRGETLPGRVRLVWFLESSIRLGTTEFRPLLQNFASKPRDNDIGSPDGDSLAERSSSWYVGEEVPNAPATRNAIDHSENSRDLIGSRTRSMIPRCNESDLMVS